MWDCIGTENKDMFKVELFVLYYFDNRTYT